LDQARADIKYRCKKSRIKDQKEILIKKMKPMVVEIKWINFFDENEFPINI
jgi:hypothetical protein